jgi:hypothetical protein
MCRFPPLFRERYGRGEEKDDMYVPLARVDSYFGRHIVRMDYTVGIS